MNNPFLGLALIGLFLWWIVPKVSEVIFPTKVDAFYYPDRNNLSKHEAVFDLKNLDECRNAVRRMAAAKGDPNLTRGTYECGVGFIRQAGDGLRVYKETVR
jgi:hypothetical protein